MSTAEGNNYVLYHIEIYSSFLLRKLTVSIFCHSKNKTIQSQSSVINFERFISQYNNGMPHESNIERKERPKKGLVHEYHTLNVTSGPLVTVRTRTDSRL